MTMTINLQSVTQKPNPGKSRRKAIREVVPIYWRRLIEVGVPINTAKVIAVAIARYDTVKMQPDLFQRNLISQYSRFICRAELWRSNLLLLT